MLINWALRKKTLTEELVADACTPLLLNGGAAVRLAYTFMYSCCIPPAIVAPHQYDGFPGQGQSHCAASPWAPPSGSASPQEHLEPHIPKYDFVPHRFPQI